MNVSTPKTQLKASIHTMQSFPYLLQANKYKLDLERLRNSGFKTLYYT
jgi:hypothetical protein